EYTFFYYDHIINLDRKVTIDGNDQTIEKILNKLFEGTSNTWYIKDKQVYITQKEDILTDTQQQQTRSLEGKIIDRDGEPLIGASIIVRGTGKGTITNMDGEFTVDVTNETILDISYVGYVKQSVRITNQQQLTVVMQTDELGLEEVVIIGYGVMKKSDLTGSVASVKAEDLEKFPAANVTEMLRGQAPGVQVTLNSTEPGGSSSVLIRGKRSLSSSQNPLYLVDGMIVPHIDDLNSTDIASIEILKDASSQAIYGSRASNGVIMITTKRGETGKTQVDFNSYVGFQTYRRNFDMYSPEEFIQLRYWAKYNEGMAESVGEFNNMNIESVLDDAMMYDAWVNNKFTNWEDLMLSNALQHKHDLSIRGGTNQLKYTVGLGYFDQDGMVENSGYRRATFRTNLDYSPFNWLDMGTTVSYTRDEKQSAQGNFNEIITMPALAQAYNEDGELLREVNNQGDINPLWRNREYDQKVQNEYLMMSAYATFKLFKGFSYRVDASIRSNNRESGDYKTKLFPASTGEGSISTFNRQSYLVNNVITYQLPIADENHKLSVTLIQSVDQDLQKTTGYSFINSTTDRFHWNIAQDSEIDGVTRTVNRSRSVSFAGRVQYNLMDRYLLTASIRRDGASVFGEGNKWANFPSVALAWRINEETFMQDMNWLDMLKLRISYGVVGNWAISSYRTLGLANNYEYLLNDKLVVGYLPTTELLNKNLKWETTNSTNFGIDFSIFNGKLSGSLEHYQTYTNDLLIRRSVPTITGYSTMWDNLGKTKSWGWEAALHSKVIKTRDLEWNIGATISTQRNKIVRIDGRMDEDGNPVNDLSNNWFIGESMNVAYNYVFGGIWQEGEVPTENDYLPGDAAPVPGDIKLLDYNGDGQITTDDRKIYNLDPDWYATINTSFYYKGIDLSLEFYTVQNVTKSNPYLYAYNQGGSLNGKKNGIKVNYWTPENRSNEAPRPQYTASVPYFGVLAYQDASYFRLRTATLGYTFPKKWTTKVHIEKLRFYFTGTNLFTVTDYKSYSPEKEPGGYPEPQTFTFGVNVSF
ncbi:MAG: TonB-dependent receptor, partial [Tannerellaceae bacterium]|nr:TonB-dependent receptor [Tannerellaceae bacterium]